LNRGCKRLVDNLVEVYFHNRLTAIQLSGVTNSVDKITLTEYSFVII